MFVYSFLNCNSIVVGFFVAPLSAVSVEIADEDYGLVSVSEVKGGSLKTSAGGLYTQQ